MSTQRIEFVDLIPLEKILPDPNPIRRELNQEHILDLIDSFNLLPMGPLDPLVVKPIENGLYQIISGNHRYMALKEGGWVDAPCHVIEPLNDAEEFLMKLHANTKRKNLNPLEYCEALAREKRIYETFYPETKHGRNQYTNRSAQCEHSSIETQTFYKMKSSAMGVGPSTLRRDIQIGQVVQEIPELKDAQATKMEAYAIAQRKPEERAIVKNALQASINKPETLRIFTRHNPKQPEESPGDYAYRYFKDAHRLLKEGIDWGIITETSKIFELENSEMFLRLSEECMREHHRIKDAAQEFREQTG